MNTPKEKSPAETVAELRTMMQSYAVQEIKDPLVALGRWVAFGLAGAVLVVLGAVFLAFAVLRFLQAEVDGLADGLDFLNYLIASGVLLGAMGLAAWAVKRTFD